MVRHSRSPIALTSFLIVLCAACGPEGDALYVADVQAVLPRTQGLRTVALSPGQTGRPRLYEATAQSETVGYVVSRQAVSRSGPFRVRVILDESFQVRRVDVVSYPHRHGRGVLRRSFAEQFTGMGPGDRPRVDAVSGATLSCRAVSKAVREAIDLAMRADGSRPSDVQDTSSPSPQR